MGSCLLNQTLFSPIISALAVVLATSTCLAQRSSSSSLVLVKEGRSQCLIVLGKSPSSAARDAAGELQGTLEVMAGVKVPVLAE